MYTIIGKAPLSCIEALRLSFKDVKSKNVTIADDGEFIIVVGNKETRNNVEDMLKRLNTKNLEILR